MEAQIRIINENKESLRTVQSRTDSTYIKSLLDCAIHYFDYLEEELLEC